ncbi:MAG: LLM class F420-dependent oxidoreductase [Acidimicrobiia bacterium]|nr:LLM class F420-dependent oxidoreductase [Acidimicrobiia bacterium]
MDIGLHVASFSWPDTPTSIAPVLGDVASSADQAGFRWLSVMDHWFQMEMTGPEAAFEPMLEGYTTLGFLAARTEQVRLGLLVTGITYRHPGLLAKTVTTLDVLSGGRAQLGIGAAWYEREHAGLGVPFPPLAERFERLEETLQICRQMWTGDTGPFNGTHYQLAEPINVPPPISDPHPPVMIGGSGEKKTLRLVAQYGDACNLFAGTPDEARHKLDVLRGHCDTVGTDYDTITKTILYMGDALMVGEIDRFTDEMAEFAAAGIEGVMVMPLDPDPVAFVDRLAPAIPRLGEIEAG